MKIEHIVDRNWALYWEEELKNKKYKSGVYELRIYIHKELSYFGYRYQLDYHKRGCYTNILKTDSKEEMKMTLELMGLRIEKGRIFMKVDSTEKITIIGLLIDLIEK